MSATMLHPSLAGASTIELPVGSTPGQIATAMMQTGARVVLLMDEDGVAMVRARSEFIRSLSRHREARGA